VGCVVAVRKSSLSTLPMEKFCMKMHGKMLPLADMPMGPRPMGQALKCSRRWVAVVYVLGFFEVF
jgi:hypothetical protein